MADPLSLLIKPVSADCNMQCTYCFYRRPGDPYRSEERHIMDDMTLKTMISDYMKSAGRCASFGWQGGEPLLAGIDFFRRVVAYQQSSGLSGQLVSNNLQTNGILLNNRWAKFFRRYNFFIGVSLDGPEADHNHYRHSPHATNSFQRTMRGIQTLREHEVEFSILTVVNTVTAKKPRELYDFFISKGFYRLQFIPCVEIHQDTQAVKDFSVGVEDYREFLCTLFDVWYNNGQPVASIRLFENILALYLGIEPEICAFKNRCGSYAVVEYNGDVYPCDFFVEDHWRLGNLLKTPLPEIAKNRQAQTFNKRKSEQTSECNACEWNFICHFGCQHYHLPGKNNYLCEAYKAFFHYTQERFQRLKERIALTGPPD